MFRVILLEIQTIIYSPAPDDRIRLDSLQTNPQGSPRPTQLSQKP